MTLQDTKALPGEQVRIVKHYKGRLVNVSGVLSATKAEKRLIKLRKVNPRDRYETVPAVPTTHPKGRAR